MRRIKMAIALFLCAGVLVCGGCGAPDRENGGGGTESATQDSAKNDAADSAGDGSGSSEEKSGRGQKQVQDFEMTFLDGRTASLKEYRGKKILLNFWATWCGPCVGEMPAFQRLSEEYPEKLVILAVNCGENQSTVQQFVESNQYSFPVVLDKDGAIQDIFGGMSSIPVTVIIDEEGGIISKKTGAADADTMYQTYKEELGL